MMQDKLGISFLFILGKTLFLLPLKRILAENGKLSRKHKKIRLAACLVQLSGARKENLGCQDLALHDQCQPG